MSVVRDSLRPLYYFLKNKNYRELFFLSLKYGNSKRYTKRPIKFLDNEIEVVDFLSFYYQFKEIFYDESFRVQIEKEKPVIYDCGANIGISALYFKMLYPNSIVKAFEADPDIFKCLKSNIARSRKENGVEFINKAVWIHNNGVEFSQEGADGGSLISNDSERSKKFIESIRLKDLIEKEHIDFLKIDIEGAEADVLIDCDGSFSKVDRIFFEYHSFKDQSQRLQEILTVLSANGFRYFIQSPYQSKAPFIHKSEHPTMDMQLNVYCYK